MDSADLVLGIDLGTTCFKAALFDRRGVMRGLGRVTLEKDERDGHLCELPADRFWGSLREAIDQALEGARARADSICAVSYSSQANSFLLLDEHETPLTPLVLWPDRRALELPPDPRLETLRSRSDFLDTTGLGLHGPEFCVDKLAWFQRRYPVLWGACSRIQTISDHLVFSLTGMKAGDQGTAALLGLWDLSSGGWWDEGLKAVAIRPDQLSQPLPPGTLAGVTTSNAADLVGLPAGIPLAVGSLDHHAAAIGAGICSAEVPCISIGTVVACLRYLERFAPSPGCAMGPGTHGYPFYLLAFEENGTGALDRYHRRNCPAVPFAEMLGGVDAVPPGSDGLVASPALAGGGESFSGAGGQHTQAHFVRALMESTAVSLFELIERLYPVRLPSWVATSGGGTKSDSWMRIFADLSGIEFAVPACRETACLGAGMMAAVAAGWFGRLAEVTSAWSVFGRVVPPDPRRHADYRRFLTRLRTTNREEER